MPTTRVLLFRHAETAAPQVFHGAESDIGLSARGERQALAAADWLVAHKPVAVVSSAMRRARATAQPIAAACQVELHIEPELHERRVGPLSGMPFDALDGAWPATLERWMRGETHYAPAGMESLDDIRRRVLPIWERLCRRFAEQTCVVIAHGVVNKVILLSLGMGLGPADWNAFRSHNLGMHDLQLRDGGWQLVQTNFIPEPVRLVT